MELRRLRCFLAAANERSFRRAAERIGVAQAALSRTIAALEDELGAELFERSSRGVRLTQRRSSAVTDTDTFHPTEIRGRPPSPPGTAATAIAYLRETL